MEALLWEVLSQGSKEDIIEVLIKLTDSESIPEPVEVVAKIGNVISCRIRRCDIEQIRGDKRVTSMKASRLLQIEPSFDELHSIRWEDSGEVEKDSHSRNSSLTGEGVIIGIADWGFDFTHPNFIDEDGSSRFVGIWDQGADYDMQNPYGYGSVYYKSDIDNALKSERPFDFLDYHPGKSDLFHNGMHGTHVLDIAAGNGTMGKSGLAPKAGLLAVHLSTGQFKDLMGLGDSARLFDAIHFLDQTAGDTPLVINMSVGNHGDSHTGLSLIEQTIDYLVTSKPNRAVIQSCGNYYGNRTHLSGVLKQHETKQLEWLINDNDLTPNEIEIWYDSLDEIVVSIISPTNEKIIEQKGEGRITLESIERENLGRYYHRKQEPNTGLSQILIIINHGSPSGKWLIILEGQHIQSGRYEAWIERDIRGEHNQSRFPQQLVNNSMSTGSICNGFYTIAVGSCNQNSSAIGFFSSVGPTWDSRQVPYLVAPGVNIRAAKSASPFQEKSEGEITTKTGTSMAAPYVTGLVALLYAQSKTPLSIHEVRDKLKNACTTPNFIDGRTNRFGYGIINPLALFPNKEAHQPYENNIIELENTFLKMDNTNDFSSNASSLEELLEGYEIQFQELTENTTSFFESLPSEKNPDIQTGDLIIRRQYAHHIPAWYGVVEGIYGDSIYVKIRDGSTKVIPKNHWEVKRVDRQVIINSNNYQSYSEDRPIVSSGDARLDALINFDPTSSDTIVINKMEFKTGISGFKNYKNWQSDSSVLHNANPKGKTYREPINVNYLVLHESAAEKGNAFNEGANETSHLVVKRDDTIIQFNDLAEMEHHTKGLNDVAVGIEFVNRGWLSSNSEEEGIPAKETSLTEKQKNDYAEDKSYLWLFWGDGFNIYRVPPRIEQLEKLVELTKWLLVDYNNHVNTISGTGVYYFFISITKDWLQLISYDEVKSIWDFKEIDVPADDEKSNKNLFIFTTGYEYLEPAYLKSRQTSGILSHNSCYDYHADGSFLTLYTWLRIEKQKSDQDAFKISKKLMKSHHFVATLKNNKKKNIHLLNVKDTNLIK